MSYDIPPPLIYFTSVWHFLGPSMLLQMALFHPFKWLSNIPSYHIFICSSVDGHLGCFYVLATVNSIAVNPGFWSAFPYQLMRLSIFSWVYWPFVYLLWSSTIQVLCPFENSIVFFIIKLKEFFLYFECQLLFRYVIHRYFYCCVSCLFTFLICGMKVLNFDIVQFNSFFSFVACHFGVIFRETIA